ncbi:metallo proteinase [Plectosphaerella plurivora]|uniref:Neutral protease 2 n=1 Tax=Plectosphaerella plurivora TaxID=936078 RepID=A0A9P8VH45_9PEZI|nr:metallo proteinase [Plectosphaerella plurivora]
MKVFTIASCIASLAAAASVDVTKRASPLDVKLEKVGNSAVKAVITNTGSEDIQILKTGSIFDELAVEKTEVFAGSDKVEFDGIRLMVNPEGFEASNFVVIAAGETLETEWDVAQVHDLSSGGDFDIKTTGVLQYADKDSTELAGVINYSSDVLHIAVDGAEAAKVRRDFHESIAKRAVVQADCTGTRRTTTVNALAGCRSQALAAATAATSGAAARMTEFFKSSTTATRNTVAAVFNRMATECGSSTSGVSRQYCTDIYPGGACSSGVIAYTLPSQNYMVNCPYYFSSFPLTTSSCRGISQASTTVHEVTHLTQIAGTTDQNGCYGYTCVRSLSAANNLRHADTYTLFAQSIFANC